MLTEYLKNEMRKYSLENSGKESCGLLVKTKEDIIFIKCKNMSHHKDNHCVLYPLDYIRASKLGKIVGHFHSQSDIEPSFTDYLNAYNHNIYSIVYSWKSDRFSIIEPELKNYLNLDYELGKNDCFELVKNYYKKELHISISEFKRYNKWELDSPTLITDNIEKEGFKRIKFKDIMKNDVIVFNIYGIPSHLSIYMGNYLILHHPENEKSIVSELSEGWIKRINCILRHKDNKYV